MSTIPNPFAGTDTVPADDPDAKEAAAVAEEQRLAEEAAEKNPPIRLADAATSALSHDADQAAFDGLENDDMTKVKFLGMAKNSLDGEDLKIGTDATFIVHARCVGVGEDEMADGHTRSFVKMRVEDIQRQH